MILISFFFLLFLLYLTVQAEESVREGGDGMQQRALVQTEPRLLRKDFSFDMWHALHQVSHQGAPHNSNLYSSHV